MSETVLPINQHALSGTIEIPGDKSISHRSIILGSLANGVTKITNFLDGEDCMRTIQAFQSMGVSIRKEGTNITIDGKGIAGLQEPSEPLYFGNSGTTARLMLGVLSGLPFFTTIYGDEHLVKRPMDRVVTPLRKMNANIDGRNNGNLLPIGIRGQKLTSIEYTLPVKSAQVKSAILLAGLFADGVTTTIEQTQTRDHTENMLEAFGADISRNELQVSVTNKNELVAQEVHVPGDISSAAFFLVAAAIVPNSNVTLRNVGLNKTRTGIIDVLIQMGANIEITNEQVISGERIGDITIQYSELKGITIDGEIIPRLIDEIPIIALLATQATGKTIIKDAEELKVKETDRISAVVDVLSTLGAKIEGTTDGMIVEGKTSLHGGNILSYHDHRIAMMGVIASLIATETVVIDDVSAINISYPTFFDHLNELKK